VHAYRICRASLAAGAFSGEGARVNGGRWNEKGTRLVYCSSSVSLAMLEVLVHTPSLPRDMVTIRVTVPDDVRVETWTAGDLPADWASPVPPAALKSRGSAWAAEGRAMAVRVPSAIVPSETNLLVNPVHPDWPRCIVDAPEPIQFDVRL
jgi:RES domain-containing protein